MSVGDWCSVCGARSLDIVQTCDEQWVMWWGRGEGGVGRGMGGGGGGGDEGVKIALRYTKKYASYLLLIIGVDH